MKIINNPNPRIEVIKKTCDNCECEFLFRTGEIKYWTNGLITTTGEKQHHFYIECPNCGKQIILDKNNE